MEVAAMRMPTLISFADADAIRLQHIMEFFTLLGGGSGMPGWKDHCARPRSWPSCRA